MFCNVRRYRVEQSDMAELMHRIDSEFTQLIEREPGFVGYHALDCGDGLLVTITMFHDAEGAENSAALAADYVRDNLADFEIERLDAAGGEVRVNRAVAEVLEPAHA